MIHGMQDKKKLHSEISVKTLAAEEEKVSFQLTFLRRAATGAQLIHSCSCFRTSVKVLHAVQGSRQLPVRITKGHTRPAIRHFCSF